MVRANFKGSALLESIDSALKEFHNGAKINPPYDKYYRIGTAEEVADLEGMSMEEFEEFEAENPVRKEVNVLGYAIVKDEYREQVENAAGLIYTAIGDDGKLYYNVADHVYEVEPDDVGLEYDEMGEVIESNTPSKSTKKKSLREGAGPDIGMDEGEPEIVTVITDTLDYEVGPANLFVKHFEYYDMEAPEEVKEEIESYGNSIIKIEFYMGHYPECFESHNYSISKVDKAEYRDLLTKAEVPLRGGKEFGEELKQRILSKLGESETPKKGIKINAPFNKYYRVATPKEICEDYAGCDVKEYDKFLAEDPCNEEFNIVGYAIAKDKYMDALLQNGIEMMSITDEGDLVYMAGGRIYNCDLGEIGFCISEDIEESDTSDYDFDKMNAAMKIIRVHWDDHDADEADKWSEDKQAREALGYMRDVEVPWAIEEDGTEESIKGTAEELDELRKEFPALKNEIDPLIAKLGDASHTVFLQYVKGKELNEIGPLAAGLIGAAGGAIIGNLATSALSGDKEEAEELNEDGSKDDEPAEYFIMWDVYERYGGGNNIKQAKYKAKTLKDAVKKLASKLQLYLEPESVDDPEEFNGDARAAIESIEESNGDGCDYIMTFKNNTTGEVYIQGDWSPEDDEDWDDDYDESEKLKEDNDSMGLPKDQNTSTIFIDLSEIISYAEKYISKELRMAGGSDVKISARGDGQYTVTLNRTDNSIKAYCNLGMANADEALEESDYSHKSIMNNIYDILSNHNDEFIFEEGCNLSLTEDNKIYIDENLDGDMYVLTLAEAGNINEAENPDNKEFNSLIKAVLTGQKKAKRELNKMGYDVEYDNDAQKQFGKKYFGKYVTIKNLKTGKEIHASYDNYFHSDDSITARQIKDTSASDDPVKKKQWKDTFHAVKPGKYASKDAKKVDPNKFDYKGYLDKETPDLSEPVSDVAQFRKDKAFLKNKEWEARQIDQARERVASVRDRLNKNKEDKEEA